MKSLWVTFGECEFLIILAWLFSNLSSWGRSRNDSVICEGSNEFHRISLQRPCWGLTPCQSGRALPLTMLRTPPPFWKVALPEDTDGPVSPCFTMLQCFTMFQSWTANSLVASSIFLEVAVRTWRSYEKSMECELKLWQSSDKARNHKKPIQHHPTVHLNSAVNLLKLIAQLCQSLLEWPKLILNSKSRLGMI